MLFYVNGLVVLDGEDPEGYCLGSREAADMGRQEVVRAGLHERTARWLLRSKKCIFSVVTFTLI